MGSSSSSNRECSPDEGGQSQGSTRTDAGPSAIDVLPDDLLSLVFSKLDVGERAQASRVCRRWRGAALQPPYSTELVIKVHLPYCAQSRPVSARVLMPEDAAAVLRGPLCGGLRRLRLLPSALGAQSFEYGASALGTVGAALPPTLRALHVGRIRAANCRAVLAALELARNAPGLEDLDLADRPELDGLALGHPALRRVGARLDLDRLGALRRFPRLEVVALAQCGWVEELELLSEQLAAVADAGIRIEQLELWRTPPGAAHLRLLRPGSVLRLVGCPVPADDLPLPAGLAELELRLEDRCGLTPAFLEALLSRTGSFAPRLKLASFDDETLCRSARENPHAGLPRLLSAALQRFPGGTQLEIGWPKESDWISPDVFAPLARALATSPALQRYVHLAWWSTMEGAEGDLKAYRLARAAALRGMGEAGRQLLADQGYD